MSTVAGRLADVLQPALVRVPLDASTVADAANLLCAMLDEEGWLHDAERLRERIEEARAEEIVGLGDRAFVLHYRTRAVKELVAAIGVTARPMCRELADDETQCARVVLLVCAPPRQVARHLQVVGALVRVLSRRSVVQAILAAPDAAALVALPAFREAELSAQLTVRELMTERPRTIGPDAPLGSAVLDMVRAGLGGLPVVDAEGRVIGMLSERELLRDLLSHYLPRAGGVFTAPPPPGAGRRTVRDLMTRQVLCVAPEQPIAEVASLMLNKDVDRVPVVQAGRLVGFLTRGDIVRKLIGS